LCSSAGVVAPGRRGLSPTLCARPGSLLFEKSPEKRSFFSVQRCRLIVGDKPLLPASERWRSLRCLLAVFPFDRSWNGIGGRRVLRCPNYHCASGCGAAGFPIRQLRPALNAGKRPFFRAFAGGKGPRMGAEPAGRKPCRPAAALEVSELNGDVHHTIVLSRKYTNNQKTIGTLPCFGES
jgi:hypothetical protein